MIDNNSQSPQDTPNNSEVITVNIPISEDYSYYIQHKTPPLEGRIVEILKPNIGENARGTYHFQPIVIEWEDIFLGSDGSSRKVIQQAKVSLTGNVADKVAFKVGDYVLIREPQYVVAGKGNSRFQNINANFISFPTPEEIAKRNGIVN